ncbi:protoporphyrinogen/coproporphyrinogen oxidase [Pedobacter metabolipauper]|uniref:UDP-galactopyranose mutase n=1 Tax=Pedobacter metabolipauper TaxID=425513 RepID=A0A4R6SVS3_9SPHI|nr:NAD(P)-binding protein [Pedobacter metabolipauper]TDQ09900.1 UDP-galactopyranose mutase [Pedobacter metabolipauper]
MKVGILGAGISGLSIARMLNDSFDVEILECASEYGGIAKTKQVEGVAYHKIGGHCFNSKYPEVLDFVFEHILRKEEWHVIHRDAVIKLKGQEVSYPIEYAIGQIHQFDPQLAIHITRDFLSAKDNGDYTNLEDWFRKKFGDTLADVYFLPYNRKIWNKEPNEMSPAWVEGKLPIPDKESFFKGLISNEQDKMPHASFYYPNTNDQKTFIDSLAEGLNISLNYKVDKIEFKNSQWEINAGKTYDILISTLPLNIIPGLIQGTPEKIKIEASKLKYNKVSTMLWETKPTTRTWTYVPDPENLFHRYIHIGSFFNPSKNYSITEVVGERTYEEMVENGKKDPFLIRPVDYNVSGHAYVVFDENYDTATKNVKDYLQQIELYTLGRFGEWQYYNMDICIKSSLETAKKIKEKYYKPAST